MVWKREGPIRGEGGKNYFTAPTAAPEAWLFTGEGQDCVCAPACLSFMALPLATLSAEQCLPSSGLDPSPAAALPLLLMDSLLPSPFSRSSLAAFFPTHFGMEAPAPPSLSPAFSSGPIQSVPSSAIGWRRSEREATPPISSKGVVRFSASLASLASSLPPFSSAEKSFVVEAKEGLQAGRREAREQDDAGDGGLPVLRNFMAGSATFRKEAAVLFKQLPIRRGSLGRAGGRRKDGGVEVFPGSERRELRAETIREGQRKALQTSKHLLAGAVAAMVSRTIVAPLERLKLEYLVRGATANVLITLRTIFMNEGVKGFWKGNGVNILRTAPFKSINFFAYDTFRKQLLRLGDRTEVTNIERLAAGAAAGVTATILCFPLDTIRTLVVAPGGEMLGGMRGCFKHILRTEGVGGLYKGLPAAVVSMAPSGAVFYGVYDILKSAYLNSPEGKEMLKARQKNTGERPGESATQLELGTFRTLLFGAIAGACAETVTYPLEVVRRAQQMQFASNKLGMFATIQCLAKKGGVGALYAGILPSTLQVLPSAALSYFVYETVKIAFKIPK